MPGPALRIGLLLDSYEVPAWAYHALLPIAGCDYAHFSLAAIRNPPSLFNSRLRSLLKSPNHIAYNIFDLIDTHINRLPPDPFAPVDLRHLLRDVPILHVAPQLVGECEQFFPQDIRTIEEHKLDILIKMGFCHLQGPILSAARYGVWSYHHADFRRNRGGPPGFWEVVQGWPETGLCLYSLSEKHRRPTVLYRSSSFTHPYSPSRNRRYCFWASSSFLSRQVNLLYRLGETGFRSAIDIYNEPLHLNDHPPYGYPSNTAACRAIARLIFKHLFRACEKAIYLDQWKLMFDLNSTVSSSICAFQSIVPPKDRFWADPCVIHASGSYYIFVEEYLYKQKKGRISVIMMDEKGHCSGPAVVLEKEYHLSYPFVFEWQGKYFMVPESSENKTIDLYECIDFPHRWKLRFCLMKDVSAVDTTLIHHNGKWWLFAGMAENEGALPLVELFLFHANDLITDRWNPHTLNPIVSDVKRARPAGRLFRRGTRLFRPSQDCSKLYGYGFDLNEILLLSDSDYREERVISVRPNWDRKVKATHTYASDGQLTVIDALTRRSRLF